MAELTKITSPMIPRENIGSKNRPVSEQTVEINDTSKVNKTTQDTKIMDREAGGQALRENLSNAAMQPLLRDTGNLMYNVQKMIVLLRYGMSSAQAMQDPQVKELLSEIFTTPEHLMELLQQQDEASVLFKGHTFDVLRDILERFDSNPKVKDAAVHLLKVFDHHVNSQNSIKTILFNCINILDYMFTKDREQFAGYLDGLAEMLLEPEEPVVLDEEGNVVLQQGEPLPQQEVREGQSQTAAAQNMGRGEETGAAGEPRTAGTENSRQAGEPVHVLDQREAAGVLKNNLLPLLGEIVVKYHQNERIRDIVMVIVHNIVRVDQGTPESMRDAVDNLVYELKKNANLPEGFDRNLMSALQKSALQVKGMQNDVIGKLVEAVSHTLRSPASSPAALRQAENLLLSMLQNESSMMNVLHFVLPLQLPDDRVFAELYVDPESNERKSGKEGDDARKIFLSADSENHGTFEMCFWECGDKVEFSLWCPEVLVKPLGGMRRMVGNLMQTHGYTMTGFKVEELKRRQTIAEVFPRLLTRKVGIDVRI